MQNQKGQTFVSSPKTERKCFFCFRSGHLIADCEAYKRKQSVLVPPKQKGVGLIKTVIHDDRTSSLETPDECFKPFIFKGTVSLTGRPENERTVTILRDTGGSQSLILPNVLTFDEGTACDTSTIVRGVGMSFVPAPLHRIWVRNDLINGVFPVAVRPCFPISGVDFIMGNYIAGGKVYPTPEVTKTPVTGPELDVLGQQHPDVFPVSILTRSQVHKKSKDVEEQFSPAGGTFIQFYQTVKKKR